MTLIAKPTVQEVRGANRIVHCQVYEQTVVGNITTNDHRPELDFDTVLDASHDADELKLCIARRLMEISLLPTAAPDLTLPASLTTDEAHAIVAARTAEAGVPQAGRGKLRASK